MVLLVKASSGVVIYWMKVSMSGQVKVEKK
jgi:hypothetical protein